jgi:hypothetical protein
MRTMAHECDVVTCWICYRQFWKNQRFVLGSEGCLLDVFSEETKYAVGRQSVTVCTLLIHFARARKA